MDADEPMTNSQPKSAHRAGPVVVPAPRGRTGWPGLRLEWDTTQTPAGPVVSIALARAGNRWRFSCGPRDKDRLLQTLAELADRPDCPLDWFDATLVARVLGVKVLAPRSGPGPKTA
jgi:hypothetical protein